MGGWGGRARASIEFSEGGIIFEKNHVDTEHVNIILIYNNFILNRNRTILVREQVHDFRNGRHYKLQETFKGVQGKLLNSSVSEMLFPAFWG